MLELQGSFCARGSGRECREWCFTWCTTGAKSRSSSKKLVHRRKGCLYGGTSRPSGCTVYTAFFIIWRNCDRGHKTRLGSTIPRCLPLMTGLLWTHAWNFQYYMIPHNRNFKNKQELIGRWDSERERFTTTSYM